MPFGGGRNHGGFANPAGSLSLGANAGPWQSLSQAHPYAIGGYGILTNLGTSTALLAGVGQGMQYPFEILEATRIEALWVLNGAVAAGNWQVAIYDLAGNQLATTGTVAMVGTNVVQRAPITPITLQPGTYRMSFAGDSAVASFSGPSTPGNAGDWQRIGVRRYAAGTGFPLPATDTATAYTSLGDFGPYFGYLMESV